MIENKDDEYVFRFELKKVLRIKMVVAAIDELECFTTTFEIRMTKGKIVNILS
jgi:hypothetical protein